MKRNKKLGLFIVEAFAPQPTGKDSDFQRAVTTDRREAFIAARFYTHAGYSVNVSVQQLESTSVLGIHFMNYEDFFAKELTTCRRYAV